MNRDKLFFRHVLLHYFDLKKPAPRPTRVNETGDIVMKDTGRSTLDKRGDAYAERTRNGQRGDDVRAGLGDDRDLGSSLPSMDYPGSSKAWTEARTKRARKRMRTKEKERAAPNAGVEVRNGQDSRRVVVPPPSVGGTTAGVRRARLKARRERVRAAGHREAPLPLVL
ncbi:hypothetical protein ALC57_15456 [Trachymyrmex cornetzi]|uniref:Uncharacterized protein n=1 Tax=Trachymyrmex cornetzi TaxID=471704 RepID=A0A151IX13_9HYME|nr:hypothetical protein ALC57_15456 [Trachymyrmex cornetzi]